MTPVATAPNVAGEAMEHSVADRPDTPHSRSARQNGPDIGPAASFKQQPPSPFAATPDCLTIPATAIPPQAVPSVPEATPRRVATPPQSGARHNVELLNDRAGVRGQDMLTDPPSFLRSAPRSLAKGEMPTGVRDETVEAAGEGRTVAALPRDVPPSEDPRDPAIAAVMETGESTSLHSGLILRASSFTNSEASGHDRASALSSTSTSNAQPGGSGAPMAFSTGIAEHSAQRAQAHDAGRESIAMATATGIAQPPTSHAADAALRAPTPAHGSVLTAEVGPIDRAFPHASAQDPFAALDRETEMGAPAWTHAAGQHAEAGFRDPDLGWVGVRADLNASGIHATLVPSSADAAQTLGSHLVGLSSHLAEEHAPVVSLSMASPSESGGPGQHMQQGTDDDGQGRGSGESGSTSRNYSKAGLTPSTPVDATVAGTSSHTLTDAGELRGTRISVTV